MNARQLQIWFEWLRRHPARRLGAATAIAAAAFCAATAPRVMADEDSPSSMHRTPGAVIDDSAITTKAKAALVSTDDLKSGHIHVRTRHGSVLLTGSVPNERQHERAVEVVKAVEGVQDVRDQLTVREDR
ncbi:hyperosmotically inducible periplasmic protein [Burkholderia multivorans]